MSRRSRRNQSLPMTTQEFALRILIKEHGKLVDRYSPLSAPNQGSHAGRLIRTAGVSRKQALEIRIPRNVGETNTGGPGSNDGGYSRW